MLSTNIAVSLCTVPINYQLWEDEVFFSPAVPELPLYIDLYIRIKVRILNYMKDFQLINFYGMKNVSALRKLN